MQAILNHFQSIVYLVCGIVLISSLSMLWIDATLLSFMDIRLTMDASGWGVINGDMGWIGMTGPVCVLIAGIIMVLCPLLAFVLPRIGTGAEEIVGLISKGARTVPSLAIFGVIYFYFDAKNFEGCGYVPDEWIGYAVWVAGPIAVVGAVFGITSPRSSSRGSPFDSYVGSPGVGERAPAYRSVRRQRLEGAGGEDTTAQAADDSMGSAKDHFMRAADHRAQKDYDQAIEAYTEAITVDPSYALAFFNRGAVYVIQNRMDEALADFHKVVEIASDPGLSDMAKRRINDLTLG